MKKKINQKGFIPIPIIIAITSFLIIIGGGVVLYETNQIFSFNNSVDSFFDSTGGIIYKLVWQNKFEKKMLEQEVKFSNVKREQAETWAEEENIARIEAEEETQKETIRRNQAEAKAKQEEFEKKLKEQQLSEKEAEEKRMNTDNDGDGLTYRRELELGTSDWNTDSDGDGIKDGEDAHPAGGGRYEAQTFKWDYGGYEWTWTINLHTDWVEYYRNKPRGVHPSEEYVTTEDPFIKDVANRISEAADEKGISKSRLALAFVQSLDYVDDIYTGYNEYPKYPVETFFEKNGDCEDSSYLAASIVGAMNIGNMLVLLPGHMAVAIWIDCDQDGAYYKLGNKCYYYGETTDEGWQIGEIPPDFQYSNARLTDIYSGEIYNVSFRYNQPCDYSSDFSGYYTDGNYYYSDSNCNNRVYCLSYEDFYYNYSTEKFYWNSNCSQIFVEGCYKSTSEPGYFIDDYGYYYHDSRCINKAKICKYYPDDGYYFDGDKLYWDSNCTQRVMPGCDKSIYHPGYFFDGWDYYSDYQCSQKADL